MLLLFFGLVRFLRLSTLAENRVELGVVRFEDVGHGKVGGVLVE